MPSNAVDTVIYDDINRNGLKDPNEDHFVLYLWTNIF